MDNDEQRDAAEERYNREFCPACGTSPCQWDGRPDEFHTDEEPAGHYHDPQGTYDYCDDPRCPRTSTRSAENCAYVRRLLEQRQPAFAACLELAARIPVTQGGKPA